MGAQAPLGTLLRDRGDIAASEAAVGYLQQSPALGLGNVVREVPHCFLSLLFQITSQDGPVDSEEPRCSCQTLQSLLCSPPSSRNEAKSVLSSAGHHLSYIPQMRSVQSQDSSLQLSELDSAIHPFPGPPEDACPNPGFPPP